MSTLIALFVGIAISFSSVYVFASGHPQPADFVFMAVVALVALRTIALNQRIALHNFPSAWIALTGWIIFVCIGWSLILQSFEFLLHAAFWIFNFSVGASIVYYLLSTTRAQTVVIRALCFALLISGIGVAIDLGSGIRVTGFLNNPNQLSYYSLCAMGSLLILYRFRIPPGILPLLSLSSGIGGVLAGASLAGMGGLVALVTAYMVANLTSARHLGRLFVVGACIAGAVTLFEIGSGGYLWDNIQARLDRSEHKVADWYEERRYDRVVAFPEYWFLGAGEGHYWRFYPHDRGEIHSSLGNLLFAYGAPGLTLFLMVLFQVLRRAPASVWLAMSAPLIYSLTHMGLRSTMFWLMVASVWYVYGVSQECPKASRSSPLRGAVGSRGQA